MVDINARTEAAECVSAVVESSGIGFQYFAPEVSSSPPKWEFVGGGFAELFWFSADPDEQYLYISSGDGKLTASVTISALEKVPEILRIVGAYNA